MAAPTLRVCGSEKTEGSPKAITGKEKQDLGIFQDLGKPLDFHLGLRCFSSNNWASSSEAGCM